MNRSAWGWSVGLAVAVAAGAAAIPAHATEIGPGAPEAVALPQPAACTLRAKPWRPDVRLELAPGIPYTIVGAADAIEVLLPVAGAPAPLGVKVKRGRFALEGVVPADAIPLYPRRGFVVGDVVATTAVTTLRWTDATAAEVGVELALSDRTNEVLEGLALPLRARRSCADLDLDPKEFDAFRAIGAKGRGAAGGFELDTGAPLSTKPGGTPIVKLGAFITAINPLRVLARKPGWVRVGADLNEAIVFGWVPATFVHRAPKADEIGEAYGVGGLGLSGVGTSRLKAAVSCNHDVRLVAEAAGQRRVVGTIGAGIAMQLLKDDGAYAVVRFDGLGAFEGAQFLVERAALTGCSNDAP